MQWRDCVSSSNTSIHQTFKEIRDMKNEPKIRIKGFEGEWKTCTLEDCLTIYNEQNSYKEFGRDDVLSVSDDYGIVNQIELLGRSYAGVDVSGYKILRPNEIVYTKSPLKMKPYGIIKADRDKVGIVSALYAVYKVNENISPDYIHYYFDPNYRINRYLLPLINKGAKNTMNISDEIALKGKISIPCTLPEQRAIATYFRHLDSLIETADKKVASLKQIKEASLQSMFPKEGQKVPEVRFKGFEGEWKVCKGEDLFETYNERNRPDLPVLSAFQDIRGMAVRSDSGYEISHNKRNEVTYKVVKPGQFVMHLRSFQGGFAHSSIEGITSPAYTVFGFKESNANNDYYWKTIFMSKEFIERLKTITYGIRDGRSISFPEFLKMKFRVPSIDEQRKIASFFVHLDKQIAIAQQRLDLLRRIKSACLDEMFV